jgi:hypothetical protein
MILVGVILFGGMGAAGVKIWLNKRKERLDDEETLDEETLDEKTLDENHAEFLIFFYIMYKA